MISAFFAVFCWCCCYFIVCYFASARASICSILCIYFPPKQMIVNCCVVFCLENVNGIYMNCIRLILNLHEPRFFVYARTVRLFIYFLLQFNSPMNAIQNFGYFHVPLTKFLFFGLLLIIRQILLFSWHCFDCARISRASTAVNKLGQRL